MSEKKTVNVKEVEVSAKRAIDSAGCRAIDLVARLYVDLLTGLGCPEAAERVYAHYDKS